MDREQMIEQRAKAVREMIAVTETWTDSCRRIARAEVEREGRLVEAMRSGSYNRCMDAVVAYEAEFAPPQRTVEQIARDIASKEGHTFRNGDTFCAIPYSLVTELAAALGKDGK